MAAAASPNTNSEKKTETDPENKTEILNKLKILKKYFNNVNIILNQGHSENLFVNKVKNLLENKTQEYRNDGVYTKNIIKKKDNFIKIILYLLKKRLYMQGFKSGLRTPQFKNLFNNNDWNNRKSFIITIIKQINSYINKAEINKNLWFNDEENNLLFPNILESTIKFHLIKVSGSLIFTIKNNEKEIKFNLDLIELDKNKFIIDYINSNGKYIDNLINTLNNKENDGRDKLIKDFVLFINEIMT